MKPHVYLGPFVEIHVRKTAITLDTCNQPALCPRPSVGFCARCGKSSAERIRPGFTEAPHLRSYLEERMPEVFFSIGEAREHPDRRIYRLGPNEKRGCARNYTWGPHEGEDVNIIGPTMISDEMRGFQRSFQKELDQLRAQNFLLFEIRWGQIIYWY